MDAEIKVTAAENPQFSKVFFSLKPGVGQIIASDASPAARNSAFLISTFLAHSPSIVFRFSSNIMWSVS